jgi:hypothetical protein
MVENGTEVVGKVKTEIDITREDIDTIMVNGIEGGISYWCHYMDDRLKDGTPLREGKPSDTALSEWVAKLICDGKEVGFYDGEDMTFLNLQGLLKGIQERCHRSPDMDMWDAEDCDSVIQIGLYGSIVFG